MTLTENATIHNAPELAELPPASVASVSPRPLTARGATGRPIRRIYSWTAFLLLAAVVTAWGQAPSTAVLCVALSGMAGAGIAAPHRTGSLGLASAIPAGFLVVVVWGLTWGLACGALGLAAWSSRSSSLVGLGLFAALSGLCAHQRAGSITGIARDSFGGVGFLGLAGFFGWVVSTQPLALWSRINSTGTDFLRHVGMVQDLRETGLLVPGEASYPRAFHALAGWLTAALDTPPEIASLWRAVAPIGFMMLAMMLMSIMIIAIHLSDLLETPPWFGSLAAVVAGLVFLQTAWFDTFLALGSVMNVLTAVSLLALLVFGLEPDNLRSTAGWVVCASSVAVVSNGWQLLVPVVGLAALPWLIQFLRHGRRNLAGWAAWCIGALLVNHGLGLVAAVGPGVSSVDSVAEATSGGAVSLLYRPEWWWMVGIAVTVMMCVVVYRRGWRSWAASYAGMLVGAAALVAALMHISGSSWELMLYYPVKALWTSMVVVIPVATVGGMLTIRAAWRWPAQVPGELRTTGRGIVVIIVFAAAVGALGRSFAFPPHMALIAQGRSGPPSWSLALVDSLGARWVEEGAPGGALVFGVVPGADANLAAGPYLGVVDSMAMEAISYLGAPDAYADPIKTALMARDTEQICQYLIDNPGAVRVTGPNPIAGPDWLVDSGCPDEIVDPEGWISAPIDDSWMDRSAWEDQPWVFPRYADVKAATVIG